MKTLVLAAVASLFISGAANAADDQTSSNRSMTRPECELAMAACKDDDACKQNLKNNNGCTYGAPTQ
jgi:hypothetical protein